MCMILAARLQLAFTLALTLTLAACEEEPESEEALRPAVQANEGRTISQKRWLDLNEPTTPELWLASREAGTDLAPSAPDVEAFRDLLARAERRYTETPRMIANRAVQLEEMLADRGIDENARQVIKGLTEAGADDKGRGFGETAQHYFNARANGASREEGLRLIQRPEGKTLR
ncbi:hypothetical protein ATN84_20595 [Paramesorhizobium deserti]|uniref:MxaH protein n=1 Tax=Paramesorhizobium deserti TaxID=1494590 RepID=A0A135HPF3_9HYPH|nr:hypothetical protein [Paramesorhizobium deserti]KXF75085.1 hypothetical protein ATN84_20595 [Paramesorhizobium deserti]